MVLAYEGLGFERSRVLGFIVESLGLMAWGLGFRFRVILHTFGLQVV